MTFDKFAAAAREVLGAGATPEQIAKDWATAQKSFAEYVGVIQRKIESLIAADP